ncbi:hypothetical protein IG631_20819 [Alternaria alternata]|nr:hypothetical protein IG631_20819 [Alternaria alternata]
MSHRPSSARVSHHPMRLSLARLLPTWMDIRRHHDPSPHAIQLLIGTGAWEGYASSGRTQRAALARFAKHQVGPFTNSFIYTASGEAHMPEVDKRAIRPPRFQETLPPSATSYWVHSPR